FTVLLAVPLAVTGALATLLLAALLHRPGGTINLYSEIGMVLLIGLVTKNSILLVEYANQLKAKGLDTVAAVLESGRIRLRPILMTSVATIMGAIPVMIGVGAGSTSRRPLGYAIVGGIFFSTVLTLFVVPVGYVLLNRLTAREPRRVRGVPAPGGSGGDGRHEEHPTVLQLRNAQARVVRRLGSGGFALRPLHRGTESCRAYALGGGAGWGPRRGAAGAVRLRSPHRGSVLRRARGHGTAARRAGTGPARRAAARGRASAGDG